MGAKKRRQRRRRAANWIGEKARGFEDLLARAGINPDPFGLGITATDNLDKREATKARERGEAAGGGDYDKYVPGYGYQMGMEAGADAYRSGAHHREAPWNRERYAQQEQAPAQAYSRDKVTDRPGWGGPATTGGTEAKAGYGRGGYGTERGTRDGFGTRMARNRLGYNGERQQTDQQQRKNAQGRASLLRRREY